MAEHRHHHPQNHAHPPAPILPSLLRLSALERLVATVVLIGVLWIAALWAMN